MNHPPTLYLSTGLHILGLLHHLALLRGFVAIDLDVYEDPFIVRFKPYKFLTISGWCFEFQLAHIVLSLVTEWQHWRGKSGDQKIMQKYTRIKDIFFRAIVLPCIVLVCSLFWILYLMDRDLVYPAAWDRVVPLWMNHGVHSVTLLLAVLELAVTRDTDRHWAEGSLYWAVSVGYALLLNAVYCICGEWVYPFLGKLSWPNLLSFQFLFSCSGRLLLEFVWRLDGAGEKKGV